MFFLPQQMTKYFGSQVVGSHLHIIMEYMGGGALSDLVRSSMVYQPNEMALQHVFEETNLSLHLLISVSFLHLFIHTDMCRSKIHP